MELAGIVPSSIMVFIAIRGIRGRDGELGIDFVEGCLGVRETELVLEKRRFGGVTVGAC